MIYTEYLKIANCIVHIVGNKAADEGFSLSEDSVSLDDSTSRILEKYLLSPITNDGYYGFWHEAELQLNEVYTYVKNVFSEHDSFVDMSLNIAKHLYACSTHPKIKGGELCIVFFRNVIVDAVTCDAIGIFKSENKDTFLKVIRNGGKTTIIGDTGININKLDKGAVIFNVDSESGYWVSVIDKTNKISDAKYWTDEFLKVRPQKNSYNQTENLIAVTREFVSKMAPSEFKSDKAAVINRSNGAICVDRVNVVDYAKKVFGDDNVAQRFTEFAKKRGEDTGMPMDEEFQSSQQAINKKRTTTLTSLKLDQNFDIRIHGGEDLLEKGYDAVKRMKYYKLYFKEEK